MNIILNPNKHQINMMYAQWKVNRHNDIQVFDAYIRKSQYHNSYAVFAGLERIINYIHSLRFSQEDIEYLKRQPEEYDCAFLEVLKKWKFTGTISAVPEGTIVFPNEPIIRLEAKAFEAQLIKTALLNFINYETFVTTKASRIKLVSPEDYFLDFGTSSRAQEVQTAIWGARSTYIAGFDGTCNLEAGKQFHIPTIGTHTHSWIMGFDTEIEAFRTFAEAYKNQTILLVDTYNTLKSGVPNAIKIAKELEEKGHKLKGIRLDGGDIVYLSKVARKMLNEAGLNYVSIMASNLDENDIFNLKAEGAKIDVWCIGNQLLTTEDKLPSAVFELVARKIDTMYDPVIRISDDPENITTPGLKKVYRIVGEHSNKAEGDYIVFEEEDVQNLKEIKMFNPIHTYIRKLVKEFFALELLTPIFLNGKQVYELPTLKQIREYHIEQINLFWEEYLRKMNPAIYPVDLSPTVWNTKMKLINLRKYKS